MNAPTTAAELASQHMIIAHDLLFPSPTNPRKRKGLDVASLTELAQTMRPPIGIAQPILVRKSNRITLVGKPATNWPFPVDAIPKTTEKTKRKSANAD